MSEEVDSPGPSSSSNHVVSPNAKATIFKVIRQFQSEGNFPPNVDLQKLDAERLGRVILDAVFPSHQRNTDGTTEKPEEASKLSFGDRFSNRTHSLVRRASSTALSRRGSDVSTTSLTSGRGEKKELKKRAEARSRVRQQRAQLPVPNIDASLELSELVTEVRRLCHQLRDSGMAAVDIVMLLLRALTAFFKNQTFDNMVESCVQDFVARRLVAESGELARSVAQLESVAAKKFEYQLHVLFQLSTLRERRLKKTSRPSLNRAVLDQVAMDLRAMSFFCADHSELHVFLDEDVAQKFVDDIPFHLASLLTEMNRPFPPELQNLAGVRDLGPPSPFASPPSSSSDFSSFRLKKDLFPSDESKKPKSSHHSDAERRLKEKISYKWHKEKGKTLLEPKKMIGDGGVKAELKRVEETPIFKQSLPSRERASRRSNAKEVVKETPMRQSPREHASTRALRRSHTVRLSQLLIKNKRRVSKQKNRESVRAVLPGSPDLMRSSKLKIQAQSLFPVSIVKSGPNWDSPTKTPRAKWSKTNPPASPGSQSPPNSLPASLPDASVMRYRSFIKEIHSSTEVGAEAVFYARGSQRLNVFDEVSSSQDSLRTRFQSKVAKNRSGRKIFRNDSIAYVANYLLNVKNKDPSSPVVPKSLAQKIGSPVRLNPLLRLPSRSRRRSLNQLAQRMRSEDDSEQRQTSEDASAADSAGLSLPSLSSSSRSLPTSPGPRPSPPADAMVLLSPKSEWLQILPFPTDKDCNGLLGMSRKRSHSESTNSDSAIALDFDKLEPSKKKKKEGTWFLARASTVLEESSETAVREPMSGLHFPSERRKLFGLDADAGDVELIGRC